MGHGNHKEWVKDGEILLDSSMVSGSISEEKLDVGHGQRHHFPIGCNKKIIKESRSPFFTANRSMT